MGWQGKHKGKQEIFIFKWFSARQDSLIYDTCVCAYTFIYVQYINHEPMCFIAMGCENDDFLTINMEDNHNWSTFQPHNLSFYPEWQYWLKHVMGQGHHFDQIWFFYFCL